MTETETTIIPISAKLIKIDETRGYTLSATDTERVVAIYNVYLYDVNSVTHCGEITPSYDLIHMYTHVLYSNDFYQVLDIEDGAGPAHDWCDAFEDSLISGDSQDIYMHCRTVEAIVKDGAGANAMDVSDPDLYPDVEDTKPMIMERIREHYLCNRIL